jgi:hypothetical protein
MHGREIGDRYTGSQWGSVKILQHDIYFHLSHGSVVAWLSEQDIHLSRKNRIFT